MKHDVSLKKRGASKMRSMNENQLGAIAEYIKNYAESTLMSLKLLMDACSPYDILMDKLLTFLIENNK